MADGIFQVLNNRKMGSTVFDQAQSSLDKARRSNKKTTMATFANQTSNLSALRSKFDRLLEIRHPGEGSHGYLRSEEEKQSNAEVFFASQRNRLATIEKELMAATGYILPPSKESKTITELAELCRLNQVATREKLEFLRTSLEEEGYTVTSPRTNNGSEPTTNVSKLSPSLDRKYSRTKTTGIRSSVTKVDDEPKSYSDGGIKCETSLPLVTNIGGPLESVLEAEYETDGMTTPGSTLESPLFSSTYRASRNFPVTPSLSAGKEKAKSRRISSSFSLRSPMTPPTLDKLSISDSTNTLLEHMVVDEHNEGLDDSARNMNSSKDVSISNETPSNKPKVQDQEHQQQHLFEFRDEDDMITLDTTMTKNTTLCSPIIPGGTIGDKRSFEEERSLFFARMEGILERVEETILEESQSSTRYNRNEDEAIYPEEYGRSSLSISSSEGIRSSSNRYDRMNLCASESRTIPTENDEYSEMSCSKDSTNMVATQVAGKEISERGFGVIENDVKSQNSPHINRRRPTHIVVDSGIASPAHTNITMDATFMSEVNGTSFVRKEEDFHTGQRARVFTNYDTEKDDDNLSTVTPVLDRYRLDASGDNSGGLKVVPNKRSAHRSNRKRTPTPRQGELPTIAQLSPNLDYILHARTPNRDTRTFDFMSPEVTNSERHHQGIHTNTSSNQKKKVYRKTPFRKTKSVSNTEDENHDPSISVGFSASFSPELVGRDQETFSISVPPLRHSSVEPLRTDISGRHRSSVSAESVPLRRIHLQEETDTIQKIDETIERIEIELSSPSTRSRNVDNLNL